MEKIVWDMDRDENVGWQIGQQAGALLIVTVARIRKLGGACSMHL